MKKNLNFKFWPRITKSCMLDGKTTQGLNLQDFSPAQCNAKLRYSTVVSVCVQVWFLGLGECYPWNHFVGKLQMNKRQRNKSETDIWLPWLGQRQRESSLRIREYEGGHPVALTQQLAWQYSTVYSKLNTIWLVGGGWELLLNNGTVSWCQYTHCDWRSVCFMAKRLIGPV